MLKSHVVRSASQFKGIRTFARSAVRCSRARRAVEDPSPVGTLRAAGPVRPVASNSGGDVARGERGGGAKAPVEGRGKCRAILSRSSVAPLDVLMHVENNLTANLLHSFSFLFRTFRPASAAHLPDPSFCTLSDERREWALLPVRRAAHLTLPSPSRRSAEPSARARHRSASNRIHNLNF